jgi:hypothetical protein
MYQDVSQTLIENDNFESQALSKIVHTSVLAMRFVRTTAEGPNDMCDLPSICAETQPGLEDSTFHIIVTIQQTASNHTNMSGNSRFPLVRFLVPMTTVSLAQSVVIDLQAGDRPRY